MLAGGVQRNPNFPEQPQDHLSHAELLCLAELLGHNKLFGHTELLCHAELLGTR